MDNDHVDFIIFYCQEANYNNFIVKFVVANRYFLKIKSLVHRKTTKSTSRFIFLESKERTVWSIRY